MARHSRLIRNWKEERADDLPLAPHRYTWNREAPEDDLADPASGPIREWRAALPYQKGDVLMVEDNGKPKRAKVLDIIVDYDRYGDRRPAYQCAVETADGVFSKVWKRFYPGHVQRGYKLAGLAPDLEGRPC